MGILFAFIAVTVFLLGLYQWAYGGAALWRIWGLKRGSKGMSSDEKKQAARETEQLERSADRAISSSFRIIAVLAVLVWLFLGVTMILDMMGINWMSAMYARAKSYWVAPGMDSQHIQSRNETLRNMGNSFRR